MALMARLRVQRPARPTIPPPRTRTARWRRRSSVSSGWNEVTSTGPWRTATGSPSTVASTSTLGPDTFDPRRPDEHGVQGRRPSTAQVEVAPRRSRPDGRTRCGGRRCRCTPKLAWSARPSSTSAASRIIPAQVPNAGMPDPEPALAAAPKSPLTLEQHGHRGRLAAGNDQPVDVGRDRRGAHLGRASQPTADRAPRDARQTAPWSARTPMTGTPEAPHSGSCGRGPDHACHQPRSASLVSEPSISRPGMAAPRPRLTLARMSGSGSWWWPRRWPSPSARDRRS